MLIDPDELEDRVVGELGGSALFGARFRENAGRALLIPRAYPGRRTPLWQQRLKSQTLLEVAKRYAQFPIVLETYRECLRDVLDLPGLQDLLRKLHSRELSVVEVETATASPFASSLLFDYVATYMYEGDQPNAERRAAALALDRELLRELLGQEELRQLIDAGALEQVEADLQRLSERTRAESVDALHDVLRRVGELTTEEAAMRVVAGQRPRRVARSSSSTSGARWRCGIGGERRWAAAEDAGLFRDALGAVPPSGLPEAFTGDVPDAMERLVRRFARTHGPFETDALRARYGVDFTPVLEALETSGDLVRGELRPGGTQREWCDPEVLRRLRRASLAALRKEIEPADQRALARFLPNWQGVDRHPAAGAGPDRLREVLIGLQGLALPADVWERDVLPRRVGAYSPSWMDALCAAGELVWVGAGALGRRSGKVALYFREDVRLLGPPPPPKEVPGRPGPRDDPRAPARGRVLLHRPAGRRRRRPERGAAGGAVGPRVGGRGHQRRLRAAALAAPERAVVAVRARRARAPPPLLVAPRGLAAAGPGPLVARLVAVRLARGPDRAPPRPGRAAARALRHRHPRAGAGRGDPRRLLLALRPVHGARDDRRRPPRLLHRRPRRRPVRAPRRGRAPARAARRRHRPADRARRHRPGPALRRRPALAAARRSLARARHPGAYVVLAGAEPVIYVERGGKGLQILVEANDPRLGDATAALVDAVHRGRIKRLALERVDGEPIVGSEWEDALIELGFRPGPRKLTLSA